MPDLARLIGADAAGHGLRMGGIGKRAARFHAPDRASWRRWLAEHHASATQVELVFFRRALGQPCIGYGEAVEEALCFGWVDGIKRKIDERRYSYRFTPRRPRSRWSASNKTRVAALLEAGLVAPAGLAAIEEAKRNGRWDEPARPPDGMPAALASALAASPAARAIFEALTPGRRRTWQRWVADARRTETAARRAASVVERLLEGRGDPYV